VGDNRNALALAGLESTPLVPIASQTLTLAEAYRDFTSEIGLDTQQAGQQVSFYQSIVEQLQAMRDSVSGVSLDEEMSNLIKYQRAYQAAARLVTVADEIYQALVGMLD
jgi:flagellar hook-associated protein 1 FlgK